MAGETNPRTAVCGVTPRDLRAAGRECGAPMGSARPPPVRPAVAALARDLRVPLVDVQRAPYGSLRLIFAGGLSVVVKMAVLLSYTRFAAAVAACCGKLPEVGAEPGMRQAQRTEIWRGRVQKMLDAAWGPDAPPSAEERMDAAAAEWAALDAAEAEDADAGDAEA